jgi:hypothetical protein
VAQEVDFRRKNDNNFKKYGLENHDKAVGSIFYMDAKIVFLWQDGAAVREAARGTTEAG